MGNFSNDFLMARYSNQAEPLIARLLAEMNPQTVLTPSMTQRAIFSESAAKSHLNLVWSGVFATECTTFLRRKTPMMNLQQPQVFTQQTKHQEKVIRHDAAAINGSSHDQTPQKLKLNAI
jgi:hypothetical protein